MRPWASPTRVMMKLRRKKKIWMSCALAKASTTMPGRTGWPASPIHPSIPGLRASWSCWCSTALGLSDTLQQRVSPPRSTQQRLPCSPAVERSRLGHRQALAHN
ncbi:uncharacterized protein ACIBXB_001392 isoform 2-T2 [Morphnus guianensis]